METSFQTVEHNRDVKTVPSLPLLVGFYFAVRIVLEFLAVDLLGVEPSTGSAMVLVTGWLLLGLVAFCSLGRPVVPLRLMLQIPTLRWVLVFLAFALASFAWSVTVSPLSSFAYWSGLAADVIIVLVLYRSGTSAEISPALLTGFVAGSCLIAAIAWVLPAQPDLRLGNEEFFNSNQIGNLCAFAVFMAQYLAIQRRGKWGLTIAFLSLTLIRSLSKTTILAFLISEGILLIRDRSMNRRTKALLITGVIMIVIVFWGLFEAYYDIYTTTGNQAQTLTGRTAIWATAYEEGVQRPWFGHGFDAMWKVIPPFGPDRFEARHAENELLTQFYSYGIAGIVLLAGLYGSLYRAVRRLPPGRTRILLQSLLLFFLIRGLAEAEPFDLLFSLWSLVLFCFVTWQGKELLLRSEGSPAHSLIALHGSSLSAPSD